jgi:transcriptional regulator with XRE-family HTH domain
LLSSKILIAQMIKHQRLKSGLTLNDVALKLKVDRQYIWKIETGKINMSLDYLDRILTVLKTQPKHFYASVNQIKNE